MRAAWLRTREGTRRLTAKEQQDGQYREAASLEEHAADTAVSAAETAAGATLRGGKRLAQRVAQNRQKAHGEKPVQEQAAPVDAEEPDVLYTKQKPYYAGQEVCQGRRTKPPATRNAVSGSAQTQDARQAASAMRPSTVCRQPCAKSRRRGRRLRPKRPRMPQKKAAEVQKARQTAARAARLAKQAAQAAKEAAQKGFGCSSRRAQSPVGGHTDAGGGHRGGRDHGAARHRGPLHGGDGGGFCVRYFLCRRAHGGRYKRCAGHYGI